MHIRYLLLSALAFCVHSQCCADSRIVSNFTLFFAGDSTLHSRHYLDDKEYPEVERCLGSWCDELDFFVKPSVRIVNHAYSGESTKSFIDKGRWARLIEQVKPGDFVENVWFEDVKAGPCHGSVFSFATKYYYEWALYPDCELRLTPVQNINVRNVTCACAEHLLDLDGFAELPMAGVRLENVRLESARKEAFIVNNVTDIGMKDVSCGNAKPVAARKIPDWIVTGSANMENAKPKELKESDK